MHSVRQEKKENKKRIKSRCGNGYLILTANLYYFKKLPEGFSSGKLKYCFGPYSGYITLNVIPYGSTTYTAIVRTLPRARRLLIMRKPLVFLEFENSRRLALAHVDALINRFHKLVLAVSKILALKLGWHKPVGKKDGFFRTGFFAQPAKNAAQHIDLILRGITLFAVKVLFALFALGSRHRDSFCRAGDRAKTACGTAFPSLLIALQHVLPTPYVAEHALFFRIFYSGLPLEKMTQGDQCSTKDGREIDPFGERHLFLNNHF